MTQSWLDRGPRRCPDAIFALRADPRVAWCMHVPSGFAEAPDEYRLMVAVHGNSRGIHAYRAGFARYAQQNRWVILVPLFPVGLLGDGNPDGYKILAEGELRYDRLLLAMVNEIGEVLGRRFDRFGLSGYSGGGQFAHRFLYAHPDRLWGVAIGAPGVVTRIDDRLDYWFGTRDWQAVFGAPLDLDAIRRVPVRLLCGDQDTAELAIPPALAETLRPFGDLGRNRVDRIRLLLANYAEHGLDVDLQFVPGVRHEGVRCIDTAARLLGEIPHREARS